MLSLEYLLPSTVKFCPKAYKPILLVCTSRSLDKLCGNGFKGC